MFKSGISLLTGLGLAALLAGCATTEADLHTRDTARVAGDLRKVAEQPAAPANLSPVRVTPTSYVGAEVSRNLNGDPLPAKFERDSIQVARAGASSFQDIASQITQATGIPVAVSTAGLGDVSSLNNQVGVPTDPEGQGGANPAPNAGGIAVGPIPAGFNMQAALAEIAGAAPATQSVGMAGGGSLGVEGTMRLSYNGKLKGLLDLVAVNFNIGWEYKSGRIVFSKTVTRVFDVPALPILAQLSFSMDSGQTGGQGGNNAQQSAQTTGGFDLWTDLGNTLGGLVANTGIYKMSAQTGQVVVVAPPATVDRVSSYLKQLNVQLNKQVAISVKVYSVALNDRDDYSSSVTALLNRLSYAGGQAAGAGAAGIGWAVTGPNSSASGELQALSTRGDVSTVTSASVTALNGVPVPVQVANTRGFAERVEVTTSETGTTASITPGTITTGFNLHLVPKVMGDGSLLLQYGMNISELVGSENGFDVFESAGSRVQLPNVTQRNFIQQARIPNGSTLVLAGFEQVRATTSKSGTGHSGLWPLGGRNTSEMQREILVIAITPTVLDISPAAVAAYSN